MKHVVKITRGPRQASTTLTTGQILTLLGTIFSTVLTSIGTLLEKKEGVSTS
jgi:hypothetical protein